MSGDNFVDLRINAGVNGGGEDSVWPSFTDIMTVIVMIFLMVLLAFMIRNTQLIDELELTIDEKDQASRSALLNATENTSLQEQLEQVRARVLSLQNTLEDVSGKRLTLEEKLQAREKAVSNLEVEIALLSKLRDELSGDNAQLLKNVEVSAQSLADVKTDLEGTKNTLNEKIALLLADKADLILSKDKQSTALTDSEQAKAELSQKLISLTEQLRLVREKVEAQSNTNTALNEQLEDQNTLMLGLQTSREELEKKVAQMATDLEKLNELYSSRGGEVAELQAQLTGDAKRFKSLQEEFDSLDERYRKLIRPARNVAGKYVVRVEHAIRGGKSEYLLTEPGGKVEKFSEAILHKRLAVLKSKHGQKLYTKVVIPNDSGLSFDQGWKFTQSILSKYDYYTQDYAEPAKKP